METILLVEDSKFLRIATERALTKAGYQVLCAGDGEKAVTQATIKLPDLVILDMLLPKLSGPEVLQKLKANPATARIPVIVLFQPLAKKRNETPQARRHRLPRKGPLLDNPSLLLPTIKSALTKKAASAG